MKTSNLLLKRKKKDLVLVCIVLEESFYSSPGLKTIKLLKKKHIKTTFC